MPSATIFLYRVERPRPRRFAASTHIAGTLRQGPSDQVALEGFAGLLEIPDRPVVRRSRQLRQRCRPQRRAEGGGVQQPLVGQQQRAFQHVAQFADAARPGRPGEQREGRRRRVRGDGRGRGCRGSTRRAPGGRPGAGATAGDLDRQGRSAGSRGQRGNGGASPAAGRWKWRRPGGCRCGSLRWNPPLRTLSPVARATACLARPAACRRSRRGTRPRVHLRLAPGRLSGSPRRSR